MSSKVAVVEVPVVGGWDVSRNIGVSLADAGITWRARVEGAVKECLADRPEVLDEVLEGTGIDVGEDGVNEAVAHFEALADEFAEERHDVSYHGLRGGLYMVVGVEPGRADGPTPGDAYEPARRLMELGVFRDVE